MAESLPLPHALRFVIADDDEWQAIQPYLDPGEFPAGPNLWLYEDDPAFGHATDLVSKFERSLAAALSAGRLSAFGRLAGATNITQIDGVGCEEVDILGEDGTGLRIHGLEYACVRLSKPDPKDNAGKLAEKRKLEARLRQELEPFIAQLKERRGQTNYKELRVFLKGKGFDNFADSLLEKAAASAGLTKGMVKLGRPREANAEKE